MFEIAAKINEEGESVICFDPTKIIVKLMDDIPETMVCIHDYGWKDYDYFRQRGVVEGAIHQAENDARRRAPNYVFRLRAANGQIVKGHAERYIVTITSEKEIPDDLKHSFIAFLKSLKTDSIEIESVFMTGNNKVNV